MKKLFLFLCILFILIGCRITTSDYRYGPIICINFDDNDASVYSNAFPVMQQYGFQATVFANSGWVGNPRFMTWQQLTELYTNHGWEIGGHTYRHEYLPDLTYNEAVQAIKTDFDTLSARGFDPVSFAVPSGICPLNYNGIIEEYYNNIRRIGDTFLHVPLDRSYLGYHSFIMGYTANDMIDRIKSGVNDKEDLIILGFHELLPNGGYDANNCPPEIFAEIMQYISEHGYRVMTLRNAMDYFQGTR